MSVGEALVAGVVTVVHPVADVSRIDALAARQTVERVVGGGRRRRAAADTLIAAAAGAAAAAISGTHRVWSTAVLGNNFSCHSHTQGDAVHVQLLDTED